MTAFDCNDDGDDVDDNKGDPRRSCSAASDGGDELLSWIVVVSILLPVSIG